jgi:hypothetical protein
MSKRMTGSGAPVMEMAYAKMTEAELVVMTESLNKDGIMLSKDIIAEVMERTRDDVVSHRRWCDLGKKLNDIYKSRSAMFADNMRIKSIIASTMESERKDLFFWYTDKEKHKTLDDKDPEVILMKKNAKQVFHAVDFIFMRLVNYTFNSAAEEKMLYTPSDVKDMMAKKLKVDEEEAAKLQEKLTKLQEVIAKLEEDNKALKEKVAAASQ